MDSPKTPRKAKQVDLPWRGCHSARTSEWKLEHIMGEFGLTDGKWAIFDKQVGF
jgi:hypothetical protein